MKNILITTIAAVFLVGCGESQPPEPPKAKAPDISIHEAAGTGNIEAVKQHLAAGADVNAKDDIGRTPLCFAAMKGHKEVAELLIANGADVKDDVGRTPLHGAANQGQTEIAELLIANGADVNAKKDHGHTPLHGAILYQHKEVVELLITAGADVNADEGTGWTPLHIAAGLNADLQRYGGLSAEGHKEIAELLIGAGADVNAIDDFSKTPLDKAIRRKHSETPDLLRKHGGKTGEELKAEGK